MEHIDCLDDESYIRSCKVINKGKSLLIGGESSLISVWDLNCGGAPKLKVCFNSNIFYLEYISSYVSF